MAELVAVIATGALILLLLAFARIGEALKLQGKLLAVSRDEVRLWKRMYELLESDFRAVQQQRDDIQQTLTVLNQDLEANRGTWKRDDGKTLEICGLWPMGQRKERVH